ncbi:deoxyribodipyrimidine photo-lyase [Thiomicrorhabdus sp. ZW0627]|uniref:cryptochrome/photolyase family protein n=1 Tax=Thiomicrorhabdus sp. ZW0627 TaxID=3039774 RepID=UPI002436B3DC|nr:deoxyribodipyrimidine photo-lyase [Thiomicrorhabdus sp. ZW0627]MDG6773818.1 deoxyribodipyrimidine photo-lyase [Thiomicrorhabdus sp. ZW0627]
MTTTLVWIQRELRLSYLPALQSALVNSEQVVLAYFHDPDQVIGEANSVRLAHSLNALNQQVIHRGGRLLMLEGDFKQNLRKLIEQNGINCIHYSHQVGEPFSSMQQQALGVCQDAGVALKPFFSEYWFEPGCILNKQQSPYVVFTPFYKAMMAKIDQMTPLDAEVGDLSKTFVEPADSAWLTLPQDLINKTGQAWSKKLAAHWQAGESAAWQRLEEFLEESLKNYASDRDFPALDATSGLSAALHFGEISSRAVYFHLLGLMESGRLKSEQVFPWIRQLAWREFARLLLWHFPQTQTEPFQSRFAGMPWLGENESTQAWYRGMTGIPIIDAGMRELWETGVMHNRVRMLVASFLTKNLNQHWLVGKSWFDETLVDADPANNVMGWQWVAGCGVDAAPYYRLFNPVRQSQQFDAEGVYIRRWVPEIASLSDRAVHSPWEHVQECEMKNIKLGETYPLPIVNLMLSRQEHLERVAVMKAQIV